MTLLVSSCAANCPEPSTPAAACQNGRAPVGSWTGDWESFPLADPSFVRSGTIDLVVADGGRISGYTVEEDSLDRGTLGGSLRPNGEFEAKYDVSRDGAPKRYALSGSFVCTKQGITGVGTVSWGTRERGNMKFSLHRAP